MCLKVAENLIMSLLVLIQLLSNEIEGAPLPSKNVVQEICSDVDRILRLDERNMLSKKDLNRKIGDIFRRNEFDHLVTRSIGDGSNYEMIDLNTDNEVGQDGQLFKESALATGSSTNSLPFPLFFQQVNNKVTQSELNDFLAFITLGLSLGRKIPKKNEGKTPLGYSKDFHDTVERIETCGNMVKTLLTRLVDRKGSNSPDKELENQHTVDYARDMRNFEIEFPKNTTRIKTKYDVGKRGYVVHSDNVSKGEATSQVNSELADIQSQGTFEDSVVKIVRLDLTPAGIGISQKIGEMS